jgi:deoxyribodipyrimidine photo-lyase
MRALVWFRSDLRIDDNPALYHACRQADRGVLAVFAVCPAQWRAHDWGMAKVDFVLRSVQALSQSLLPLGISLKIICCDLFRDVPGELLRLAGENQADALFYNREYEVNERRRDEAVGRLFAEARRPVHEFDDQVLLPPGAVKTADGGWYTVFTPFKKRCHALLEEQGGPDRSPRPRRQGECVTQPDEVPECSQGFPGSPRPDLWPAGEESALRRLSEFIGRRAAAYARDRDFPGINGTSTLSPYLAAGVVSVRRCWHAALDANRGRLDGGGAGLVTWGSELLWREFYRHVLRGFPRVCMGQPFKPAAQRVAWREDEEGFAAWCEGRTGVPIVDAGMRQLIQSGWMHNRARMIVAMFLTKDLLIDWRRGERYFMSHLVDADLASNNGGWQWSASTGTDAVPYFRVFNPWSQGRRFDPEGRYVRRFVPQLESLPAAALHRPGAAAGVNGYPPPLVDHAQARRRVLAVFGSPGK